MKRSAAGRGAVRGAELGDGETADGRRCERCRGRGHDRSCGGGEIGRASRRRNRGRRDVVEEQVDAVAEGTAAKGEGEKA